MAAKKKQVEKLKSKSPPLVPCDESLSHIRTVRTLETVLEKFRNPEDLFPDEEFEEEINYVKKLQKEMLEEWSTGGHVTIDLSELVIRIVKDFIK